MTPADTFRLIESISTKVHARLTHFFADFLINLITKTPPKHNMRVIFCKIIAKIYTHKYYIKLEIQCNCKYVKVFHKIFVHFFNFYIFIHLFSWYSLKKCILNRILTFFHCFQYTMRIHLRNHSSVSVSGFFMSAILLRPCWAHNKKETNIKFIPL